MGGVVFDRGRGSGRMWMRGGEGGGGWARGRGGLLVRRDRAASPPKRSLGGGGRGGGWLDEEAYFVIGGTKHILNLIDCLFYTSLSPRDLTIQLMPSPARSTSPHC